MEVLWENRSDPHCASLCSLQHGKETSESKHTSPGLDPAQSQERVGGVVLHPWQRADRRLSVHANHCLALSSLYVVAPMVVTFLTMVSFPAPPAFLPGASQAQLQAWLCPRRWHSQKFKHHLLPFSPTQVTSNFFSGLISSSWLSEVSFLTSSHSCKPSLFPSLQLGSSPNSIHPDDSGLLRALPSG